MFICTHLPLARVGDEVLEPQFTLYDQLGDLGAKLRLALFIDAHGLDDIAKLETLPDIFPDHLVYLFWLLIQRCLLAHHFDQTILDWPVLLTFQVLILELFRHGWD